VISAGAFLASGCGPADDSAEEAQGALEQAEDRLSFDPNSAKEAAGEIDIRNAYSAARLARFVYDRWADENALRDSLVKLGLDVEEAFPFYAKYEGTLTNRALTGTDGFYARTKTAGFLVFRGSEEGKRNDALADAQINVVRPGAIANRASTGKVHAGFYYALHAVWDEVRPKLSERHAKEKQLPLYIIGHSLGGALGTLAAHHLVYDGCLDDRARQADVPGACERDWIPVRAVYTFGAPRLGNQEYASDLVKRFDETGTRIFRFVNEADQVSMIPRYSPSVLFPLVEHFRHIGVDGDERDLAIFLRIDGRAEPKPHGICPDAPLLVQCDPSLSNLVGGVVNGTPFWQGEHPMELYLAKMKALATGQRVDLDEVRRQLGAGRSPASSE
jgi:hypothetical protein